MLALTNSEDLVMVNTTAFLAQLATSQADVLMCRLGWEDDPHVRGCVYKLPLRGVFDGPATAVFIPAEGTVARQQNNSGHLTLPVVTGVIVWPEARDNKGEDLCYAVNELRRTLGMPQRVSARRAASYCELLG